MNTRDFESLSELATQRGLIAADCGNGHWQVRGGRFVVNYYPSRGTLYVNGTHKGFKVGWNFRRIIDAASRVPPIKRSRHSKAKRRPQTAYKLRRLKIDPT